MSVLSEALQDLARRVEEGQFDGHPIFEMPAIWDAGVYMPGEASSRALSRLGFDDPRVELDGQYFDDLLHSVAIDDYVALLENGGLVDHLNLFYVQDQLEDLGYIRSNRILRPLPAPEDMVPILETWAKDYNYEHPLELAQEKAAHILGALAELQGYLDQPAVRKRLTRTTVDERRDLISDLMSVGSAVSQTGLRLLHHHSRSKYSA